MKVIKCVTSYTVSPLAFLLGYTLLYIAALTGKKPISHNDIKKGGYMFLERINESVKPFFWVAIFIAAVYDYYYYSGGERNYQFVMIFLILIVAILVLGTYYCDNSDSVRNKKLFWLTLYFVSPILLNGASHGLRWGGYETTAYYFFKLRYWSLLKGPLFGLLYLLYLTFGGTRRPRLKRARQALVET